MEKNEKKANPLVGFVIAAGVGILAFFLLLNVEKSILAGYTTAEVIVVSADTPERSNVKEDTKGQIFKSVTYPESLIPENAIRSMDAIPDGITARDLKEKELLTTDAIRTEEMFMEGIDDPVETCFSAGSISNAVGGILRRGDRITISVTGTEDLEYEGIMFEDIYISKAMGDDGTEVTEDGTTSMFNIVMNQEDEQRLNEMISKGGTIRICKVNDVTF